MSETITYMVQQSASRVSKASSKPHKSRIWSPTSPDHKMTRNGGKERIKQRIVYAEICKTIKKKAREEISKY